MKKLFNRFAPGLLAASLAVGAAGALTTVAFAQTAAAPAAPMPPRPPMDHQGPGMHGHRMGMELERLKTSLKLNASQAALWDKAQGLMKPPADLREQMKARRDRMAAMLDDPAFDPRKLAAEMDGAESERRTKMTAMRDAWFAVYDSLNPVQRGQAREFLRSRMSHRHGMGEHRMGEGRRGEGRMGGDGMHRHEGPDGKAPMPPR